MNDKIPWKLIGGLVGALVILVLLLAVYRIPAVLEKEKTQKTVEFIQAQKITRADVEGVNLPPEPDLALRDATIEGIDENKNGIRDDVELEIFRRYPNDQVLRAAMLQYAMGLQLYLTHVFNSETWAVASEQISRGRSCLAETYSRENAKEHLRFTGAKRLEVEGVVLNTENRKAHYDTLDKFTKSFGLSSVEVCDVDI